MHTARRILFLAVIVLPLLLAIGRVAAAQDVIPISGTIRTRVGSMPCVCASVGVDADECGPFELRIHLHVDPSIASRVVLADVKNEVERLWTPYGVHVEWTDGRADEIETNGLALEAILERTLREGRNDPMWTEVLGRSFINPQAPAWRPIRVSFEATENILERRTGSRAKFVGIEHAHDLARALGRVLAHEIGHVLLAAPYHDEAGLMRPVFRPDELADPDRAPFRLTCTGVGRLRARTSTLTGSDPGAVGQGVCLPGHIVR